MQNDSINEQFFVILSEPRIFMILLHDMPQDDKMCLSPKNGSSRSQEPMSGIDNFHLGGPAGHYRECGSGSRSTRDAAREDCPATIDEDLTSNTYLPKETVSWKTLPQISYLANTHWIRNN